MGVRPALVWSAVTLALLAAAPPPARAQLRAIETPHVRLVYFDPAESFPVPHAARTCLNSLQFQKRLFDFCPIGPITVLLADFSDNVMGHPEKPAA